MSNLILHTGIQSTYAYKRFLFYFCDLKETPIVSILFLLSPPHLLLLLFFFGDSQKHSLGRGVLTQNRVRQSGCRNSMLHFSSENSGHIASTVTSWAKPVFFYYYFVLSVYIFFFVYLLYLYFFLILFILFVFFLILFIFY